jgi:signal transduction histidine kinase
MQNTLQPPRLRQELSLRFIAGVALALVFALALFSWLMQPAGEEIAMMAIFLGITAILSVLMGFTAYRLGWIRQSPHLTWTLLGGYTLVGFLTFLNVWAIAQLTFASQHDLLLVTVLLLYASGITVSVGYLVSSSLTAKVIELNHAAEALAAGDLEARVAVNGRDEMARLASAFNQLAAQLQAAAAKQSELDKLRSDLIAWVGHDLRTPLASIRAITEALSDGMVEDEATVRRYLATVQRDVQSLSYLINDLFDLAQFDAGGIVLQCEANSISDLISDTIESFSASAQMRQVTLEGAAARGVDPVHVDAQKIGRVLSNLVSNALRHTPVGGIVQVRARLEGHEVQVEVSDTGEGIRPEDLPRIFEQFYRAERSRNRATGGSGLGLAIVRRIVEAHGGRLSVWSRLGEGTRILFTLPRHGTGRDTTYRFD